MCWFLYQAFYCESTLNCIQVDQSNHSRSYSPLKIGDLICPHPILMNPFPGKARGSGQLTSTQWFSDQPGFQLVRGGANNTKVTSSISILAKGLQFGLAWWLRWKKSACGAGDRSLIPASGRSPGEENDCLYNTGNDSSILAWRIPWAESQTMWKILKRGITELRSQRSWCEVQLINRGLFDSTNLHKSWFPYFWN